MLEINGDTTVQDTGTEQRDPDVIKLRIVRSTKKVDIEDENGVIRSYTLREMTGADKGRWQTENAKRMSFDRKSKVGMIKDWNGLEASLITYCLFDTSGNKVPTQTIISWPTTVQKALFEAARKMNGLTDDEEDKEKND